MTENNFYSAMYQAKLLYDVSFDNEDDFAEVALIAHSKIGNKNCKLYHYIAKIDPKDQSVELPCNAEVVEAVTYLPEDWQYADGVNPNGNPDSAFIEQYIEARKKDTDPLYVSGRYANYEQVGRKLYFHHRHPHHAHHLRHVHILYKGQVLDDDGLPSLNDKECFAIATFVSYIQLFKKALATNNNALMQQAQLLEQKWKIACDQARTPEYVNQNDFNEILEVKSSWGRKSHNFSYKPVV